MSENYVAVKKERADYFNELIKAKIKEVVESQVIIMKEGIRLNQALDSLDQLRQGIMDESISLVIHDEKGS